MGLLKADTHLAFVVATALYLRHHRLGDALRFSLQFVVVFLLLKGVLID